MKNDVCYVYVYKDPVTMIPFYVGAGKGKRAYTHVVDARNHRNKNTFKENKIRKIIEKGNEPIIEIVLDGVSRERALEYEVYLISHYGRKCDGGSLTNLTEGGEGTVGVKKFCEKIHKFIRESDDLEIECTQSELKRLYGLTDSGISALIAGTIISTGGWFLNERKERKTRADATIYHFCNVNGGEFVGTKADLKDQEGVPQNSINTIIGCRKGVSECGWFLKGQTPSKRAEARVKKYHFIHKDGIIRFCKPTELAGEFDLDLGNLRKVISSDGYYNYKSVKGWTVNPSPPDSQVRRCPSSIGDD